MIFTRIPDNLSPVVEPLVYGFLSGEQQQPFEVRIYAADTGRLLAVKCLTGGGSREIDISPILRRAMRFRPEAGETGIVDPDSRSVAIEVTAADAVAQTRRFTACSVKPTVPSLISTMPMHRIISVGESDELTLCVAGQFSVCVETSCGGHTETKRYTGLQKGEGVALFRLDTSQIAVEAERITVEAECGGEIFCRVEYTVVPRPSEAVRLAWRSAEGSMEHHTFPVVKTETDVVTREKFEGTNGYADMSIEAERTRTLLSAYQTTATASAVAGIVSSAEAWEIVGREYTPIDIPSQEGVIKRNGGLRYVEITIRNKSKKRLL